MKCSVKHTYEDGPELWHGIDNYIRIYNTKRLNQSFSYPTILLKAFTKKLPEQ